VNDSDEPKTQAEASPTPNTIGKTGDNAAAPTSPKTAPRPKETAAVTGAPVKKTAARASPQPRTARQTKPQSAKEPSSAGYQSPGRVWPD
jgi:hypothetical protein